MNTGSNVNERSMESRKRHHQDSNAKLRERVERARDVADDIRNRAEVAFRDKPYLLPVAAGAVGLGVGVLIGSKLTRFLVFTAVGTLLTETFGSEIKRIGRDFMDDMRLRLEQGEGEGDGAGEPESE